MPAPRSTTPKPMSQRKSKPVNGSVLALGVVAVVVTGATAVVGVVAVLVSFDGDVPLLGVVFAVVGVCV